MDPMVLPVPDYEAVRRSKPDANPKENVLGLLTSAQVETAMDPTIFQIAVTVGEEIYNILTKKYGEFLTATTLMTGADLFSNGWKWLGCDVVDVNGLISGISNCGPNPLDFKIELSPYINECGLFNDYSSAEACAKMRDAQMPDHYPFHPASVWKKLSEI